MSDSRLPFGWFDIATDLRLAIVRAYPTVIVRSMSWQRGWLSVEMDDSDLSPAAQAALGRLVQGFVTQSLHTCAGCGSAHARDRGDGRVVTCDECNEEARDA